MDYSGVVLNVGDVIVATEHLGGRTYHFFAKIKTIKPNGTFVTKHIMSVTLTDWCNGCQAESKVAPNLNNEGLQINLVKKRGKNAANGRYRYNKTDYVVSKYDSEKEYANVSYY